MIHSFGNRETKAIASGNRSARLPAEIQSKAHRLLRQMMRIDDWTELRNPPGNRLHALHGTRKGQYAIRVNDQWRIVFTPVDGALADVEIIDYHS
jgi:toxin HigB-1